MDFSEGHGSSSISTSDFWPPDLGEYIPIVLSTPICGNLSWQLEEINMTFKLPQVNPAHHFLQPSPSSKTLGWMCSGARDTETSGYCFH